MTPLVCLHGFLGTNLDFSFLAQDQKILAIDISLELKKFSLKHMALNIYEQLQKLDISKAHFLGYSMGGRVLLELYRQHPEVFEKLILISASPGIESAQEKEDRMEKDAAWAEVIQSHLKTPQKFLEMWYAQDLFKSFRALPDFKKHLQMRAERLSQKHAQMVLEASPGANPSHFDLLGQLQIPVLVLLGELDEKYRNQWRNLIAKSPNIRLKIIPHAGHVAHLENPKNTRDVIKEFIK